MTQDDIKPVQAEAKPNSRTFIEDGTQLKGQLTSACHVVVCGKVEGEIAAPKLTITDSGSVEGQVRAERIYSEGVLAGSIDADELYLSGQVRSDTVIRAKTMEVKLSQEGSKYEVMFGSCTLAVGDDPRAEAQPDNKASGAEATESKQAEPPAEAPAQASAGDAAAKPETGAGPQAEAAEAPPKGKSKGKRAAAGSADEQASPPPAEAHEPMSRPSSPPPAH